MMRKNNSHPTNIRTTRTRKVTARTSSVLKKHSILSSYIKELIELIESIELIELIDQCKGWEKYFKRYVVLFLPAIKQGEVLSEKLQSKFYDRFC